MAFSNVHNLLCGVLACGVITFAGCGTSTESPSREPDVASIEGTPPSLEPDPKRQDRDRRNSDSANPIQEEGSGAAVEEDHPTDTKPMTISDLTVSVEGIDTALLLEDWDWLLPAGAGAVLITAMGDAFVQEGNGSVHFLDTYTGKVVKVSDSEDGFVDVLKDADFVNDYMYPERVAELVGRGMVLQPGKCYDYKVPGVLGGEDVVDNMETTDLVVHFSMMGQIHLQIKDLPEGTRIDKFVMKGTSEDGS